jgi:hypothetical protein
MGRSDLFLSLCVCVVQAPVDIRKGLQRETSLRMATNLGFKDGQAVHVRSAYPRFPP